MRLSLAAFNLLLAALASAQAPSNISYAGAFDEVSLSSPDGSIKANYIRLGASLTNFWVKDRTGSYRDLILGYDNRTLYLTQPAYFGVTLGRYANRLANGTFTIPPSKPIDPSLPIYNTPINEIAGNDTIHGGPFGYDKRVWNITRQSKSSVTFRLFDPDGTDGFPGNVVTTVTHTLRNDGIWDLSMHATASKKTPIMLSSHVYWNLEAFKESQDILSHKIHIDASRVIAIDGHEIPTGEIIDVTGTPFDFRKAQTFGSRMNETLGFCGTGCTGYDNCWIYDQVGDIALSKPKLTVWSPLSGIKLTVHTNQPAVQIFTCDGLQVVNLPKKADQGPGIYGGYGCFAMEQEGWIDAINNPAWGQDQIYGPGRDFNWHSSYHFENV